MSVVRNVETEGAPFFYAANRLMRQLLDFAEMGFPNDDEAVFATPARVMMQARCTPSLYVHVLHVQSTQREVEGERNGAIADEMNMPPCTCGLAEGGEKLAEATFFGAW